MSFQELMCSAALATVACASTLDAVSGNLTVLVTGGNGYIGSHTVAHLRDKGYHVIVLDKAPLDKYIRQLRVNYFQGDYGDSQLLDRIFSTNIVDAVIHCGGCIEVHESVKNPLKYYMHNVAKTVQLLESMVKYNVKKIIYSSSGAVYGTPRTKIIDETHLCTPISPYGRTKRMVEQILEDMGKAHHLEYVILRYFNVAGAWPSKGLGEQHTPETHIIPCALRAALDQTSFLLYGIDYDTPDGTCIRDYVHVRDLAEAHYRALLYLQEGKESTIINIGTGQGFSVRQVLTEVETITQLVIPIRIVQRRQGDPACLVACAQRAQKLLNWSPRYTTLTSLISSMYDFELQKRAFQHLKAATVQKCNI